MLKLDVQGFEPHVLAGAPETLARVVLLECELAFEYGYEDQPTFREMVDLIDGLGFHPISIAPGNLNYGTASLTYVDIIFAADTQPRPST